MNRRSFILATICAPFVPRLITRPLPLTFTQRQMQFYNQSIAHLQGQWMRPSQKEAYKEIFELVKLIGVKK